MPVISRRRAPSFLFPFSFAVSRHAFAPFLFYIIVLLALSTHTTCQTITFKPMTFPIAPEIAPTPAPSSSSLTLVESGNGVPKPTISPSRPSPLRDIQVPFNSSQITYTPFACNYTTGDVDPDGCEYAWRISNSTREVSISVDSGESAELRTREFIIPQMFFQFRASKLTLTTLATSNATVRLTISSANATFDAFSTTLNTSASNGQPRSLTIVDIPFEDVSILSLSVFPGQTGGVGSEGGTYAFGIQSLVVGVPSDAPIASVFPSSSLSSSPTSTSLSTSTSIVPPSTSTSSSPNDSPPSSSSSSNKKRISQALGLTLGLALGLTAVSVVGFWFYRRRLRLRNRRRGQQGDPDVVSRTSGGPSLTPSPRIRTRLGLEPYGELEKRPDLKATGRSGGGAYGANRRERDISSPSPTFDARSTWNATPRMTMSSYVDVDRKREDVLEGSPSPSGSRPAAAAPSRGLRWVWGRRRRGDSTSNSPSSSSLPVPVSPSPSPSPSPYSIPLNSSSLLAPRSPVTPTVPSRAFSFLPPSLSRRASPLPQASPPTAPPPVAPPPTPMPPTPILATAAAALIGKPIVPRKGVGFEGKDPVQGYSSSSPSSSPPAPPFLTTPIPTPTSTPIFTTNTNIQRTRPYYPETSHFIYPRPSPTPNNLNRQSSASVLVTAPRPDSQPPVGPLPPPPQSLTPLSRSRMSDSIRFSQPLLRGGLWVGGGSEGGSIASPGYSPSASPGPSPGLSPEPSPGYASVGHGTSGRRSVVGVLDVTMGYVNVGGEEEQESDSRGRRSRGWGWGKSKEQASDRVEGWFEDRDGRTRRRLVGVMGMFEHVKRRLGGVGGGVFGQRGR